MEKIKSVIGNIYAKLVYRVANVTSLASAILFLQSLGSMICSDDDSLYLLDEINLDNNKSIALDIDVNPGVVEEYVTENKIAALVITGKTKSNTEITVLVNTADLNVSVTCLAEYANTVGAELNELISQIEAA